MVFMFPGQGSQKVGMAADFFREFESVRKHFAEADAVTGLSISKLCFEGPAEELTVTSNTQPALFTVESAICDVLKARGMEPSCVCGHSLGEYSALYAAGVFSFADGLRIVSRRGQLMAAAGKTAPGTMAAVIGGTRELVTATLKTVISGVVVSANENSPDQVVISGDVAAVKEASEKLQAAGVKRVMPLPVSGAFHSPLMQQAADEFDKFLSTFAFNNARVGVVSNVTAQPETDGAVIRSLLVRQLVSPVRWVDTLAFLAARGELAAVEAGPGSVLKGLARKCVPDMNVVPCETVDNLYSLAPGK